MRKLILVRHSNSKLDPELPPDQWRLTKEGRMRCIPLSSELAKHEPEIIITSVEPKARETGEITAKVLGLPCLTAENLHEHKREQAGFLRQEKFLELLANLYAYPDTLIFGLETAREALNRFTQAVDAVMANHQINNIAIVSHGTVMSLFYGEITGNDPNHFWRQLGLPGFYTVSWPELVLQSVITEIRDLD
jgi:broad specificity phosphatase PhoE